MGNLYGVKKDDLATKLKSMYKCSDKKCIVIFGLKSAFGGTYTTGFGLIYNDLKAVKTFEPRFRLKRAGLGGGKSGTGRRGKKDVKNRVKKVRGKDKSKAKK